MKRHVEGGENAEVLAKEFKVSRASVYGWVTKYKNEILARSRRAGMAPREADRADKTELIAEIEALKLENKRLRDRVIQMMLNADPLEWRLRYDAKGLLSPPSGKPPRKPRCAAATTTGRRKPHKITERL